MRYSLLILAFCIYICLACTQNEENNFKTIKIFKDYSIPILYLDSILFDKQLYNSEIKASNNNETGALLQDFLSYIHSNCNNYYRIIYNDKKKFLTRVINFADSKTKGDPDSLYYYIFEYLDKKSNNFIYIKAIQSQDIWNSIPIAKAIYLIWNSTSEITEHTPYIKTNLPEDIIRKLYPMFKGKYIYEYYKQILIDYQYPVDSDAFFEHIEFIK